MRILGVDPGSYHCGFAIVKFKQKPRLEYIHTKYLSKKEKIYERIHSISKQLEKLTKEYKINNIACEHAYLDKNFHSAKVLSQITGIVAMHALKRKIEYAEFSPTAIKKTIAQNGQATKEKVLAGIKILLPKEQRNLNLDEHMADAAAVAIHQWTILKQMRY